MTFKFKEIVDYINGSKVKSLYVEIINYVD